MTDQQHPITPPELGPAEQLMIAVTHIYQQHGGEPPARAVAAAALRAVAAGHSENLYDQHEGKVAVVRSDLVLTIANELENH